MDREYYPDIDIDSVAVTPKERIGRCIHCGYGIYTTDDAARIEANGEAIHRNCWEEYASENAQEFLKEITNY